MTSTVDPLHDIFNWHRLDDRITTSGQPSEAQLLTLKNIGVRHIINLGLHSHENALPDERASVAALGMAYHHRPVDFANPTGADFDWFVETIEAFAGDKIHVHCILNYRVSAFFYRYRRDKLQMDEAAARADMEKLWTPTGVWAEFIAKG
jgi:protein tyrosine phosphatase (PTP) superfamily phosphohydrolase (DUF442 family)